MFDKKKRFAIIRVDGFCPLKLERKLNCDNRLCKDCKMRKNYGDTKKQLVRKIAQGIIIASKKRQIYIANPIAFSKAVSKIIIEFLGVK